MNHPKRSIASSIDADPRANAWPLDIAFDPTLPATTPQVDGAHDASPTWLTVRDAAAVLAMSIDALHMALARRARKSVDGTVSAEWDGISARKIGRRWRIALSSRWRSDPADNELRSLGMARSA